MDALALWEKRERQLAEFLLMLDDARGSFARGEGRVITQASMQQLANEAKHADARPASRRNNNAPLMAHRDSRAPKPILTISGITSRRKAAGIEIANRLIDTITDRFLVLAGFPYVGRALEQDFGPGCRSVSVGEYIIVYCVENRDALILRVVHGRRDLDAIFGD